MRKQRVDRKVIDHLEGYLRHVRLVARARVAQERRVPVRWE